MKWQSKKKLKAEIDRLRCENLRLSRPAPDIPRTERRIIATPIRSSLSVDPFEKISQEYVDGILIDGIMGQIREHVENHAKFKCDIDNGVRYTATFYFWRESD